MSLAAAYEHLIVCNKAVLLKEIVMIKVYDDCDNIVTEDKHNAEMISAYLTNFMIDHKRSLSDFNRVCLEVASRLLWRYAKYGFYKENQPK